MTSPGPVPAGSPPWRWAAGCWRWGRARPAPAWPPRPDGLAATPRRGERRPLATRPETGHFLHVDLPRPDERPALHLASRAVILSDP
ncbi:hypothetical protein [Amycolatopsis sp. cmx-8-4]|uniref:hypothetical protein n=1 Tax=Amycolatopsis sp. cmx-8-4 TaxID=2790947 RepID=UPI00397B2C46